MQKSTRKTIKILVPILLGGTILWWMYREFDFSRISDTLLHEMNWWWMGISLIFGILAQVFRGLRWQQTLAPLGEHPRRSTCIHAIFLSYASSLLIPRIGEVTRCGVLSRYEGTSFSKSLGTVITERIIDSLLILSIVVLVILSQLGIFSHFFKLTGLNLGETLHGFTTTGYIVTAICIIVTAVFLYFLLRRFTIPTKIKRMASDIKAGILSLRDVKNKPLFVLYTLGIWVSYFLHFYLTFFCFSFSANLGIQIALVAFIVGSIAVIVPTPNGLGPWHFAVKTILVLYGVTAVNAETFVLIVHSVQTALIPLLAVFSMIVLKKKKYTANTIPSANGAEVQLSPKS